MIFEYDISWYGDEMKCEIKDIKMTPYSLGWWLDKMVIYTNMYNYRWRVYGIFCDEKDAEQARMYEQVVIWIRQRIIDKYGQNGI